MDQNVSRLKRGRPLGSKDIVPRKRRGRNLESAPEEHTNLSRGTTIQIKHHIAPEVAQTHDHIAPEGTHERITNRENTKIPINYYNEIWFRNETIIDDVFALSVAHEIMNDDYEPRSITEYRQRHDWPKWEEAIKDELASLVKRDVFGPIVKTHDNVKPVGYK